MALPTRPKRDPKAISISLRVSKRAADQLKALAGAHNLSQADVVEHLVAQEFKIFEGRKGK